MGFELLEGITSADYAFRCRERDLGGLFRESALAMMALLLDHPPAVEKREERGLQLENPAADMLLFNYLGEFIFYKDSESLLLLPGAVRVWEEDGLFRLDAVLEGERIEPSRHLFHVDIKAVTLHGFEVVREGDMWRATVVLDV